jgi:hypothetical protein
MPRKVTKPRKRKLSEIAAARELAEQQKAQRVKNANVFSCRPSPRVVEALRAEAQALGVSYSRMGAIALEERYTKAEETPCV